jgi:transposase InsO family protein
MEGKVYCAAVMDAYSRLIVGWSWQTRDELANAIFEWIECWYNPNRRHSSIGMHSPITFETLHAGPD